MSTPIKDAQSLEKNAHLMDKYSRQVGEYGVEAMAKLTQMKVLVIGAKGVGIEAAKNLILAGAGEVTLYDDDPVTISDLGTNFYLSESDVSQSKSVAEACVDKLKALNPLVNVTTHQGKLTNKNLRAFDVVLDCGLTHQQAVLCNSEIRKNADNKKKNTKFIRCNVHGLVGYAFVDFGAQWRVLDKTGEPEVTRTIQEIDVSQAKSEGKIIVHLIQGDDGQRHNIEFDPHHAWVKLEEIEGELGKALNGLTQPFEVKEHKEVLADGKKVFNAYALEVILPQKMDLPDYVPQSAGLLVQKKTPVNMSFQPLGKMLDNPVHPDQGMLVFTDGMKFGRAEQLHIGLRALWKYEAENEGLPKANDENAVQSILKIARDLNQELKGKEGALALGEIDEEVIADIARYAECKFQPFCTFFGGIIAQEVVKFTGKYTPLQQWLHLDCFEVLPHKFSGVVTSPIEESDKEPLGSRYDDIIKIIGKTRHQKLMRSSTFMVGCGALGCELLKNFALLGLACDPEKQGKITVTDNDSIEISNLSRQFLFREDNVGQPKSLAAKQSILEMNSGINVEALERLVNPDSENIFNQRFWESIDFVTNALDNVKARRYVDKQCVYYQKPLLESGTLGTKCNSQIILPHMTMSYSDGPKDDEQEGGGIAMCTLRNFPSTVEHCVEWARARFTDLFEVDAQKAVNFQADPTKYINELRENTLGLQGSKKLNAVSKELVSLKEVHRIVEQVANEKVTFEACVKEAFGMFHRLFRDTIQSLIQANPEDSVDSNGLKFWTGTKRFPTVATFSTENDSHVSFVLSMAGILAANYGLKPAVKFDTSGKAKVQEIVTNLEVPEFISTKVDLSEDTDEEKKKKEAEAMAASGEDVISEFESLLAELEGLGAKIREPADGAGKDLKYKLESASFEKDDDSNFHIDFIAAASNLRSANYKIGEISRHKSKMIAGKIIPALATTTAAVTGLIMIEMLKVLQLEDKKHLDAFKDSSNSLGINGYFFSTPAEPLKTQDFYDYELMSYAVCLPQNYTKWEKISIKPESNTFKAFVEEFEKHCNNNLKEDIKKGFFNYVTTKLKEDMKSDFNKVQANMSDDSKKTFTEYLKENYNETEVNEAFETYFKANFDDDIALTSVSIGEGAAWLELLGEEDSDEEKSEALGKILSELLAEKKYKHSEQVLETKRAVLDINGKIKGKSVNGSAPSSKVEEYTDEVADEATFKFPIIEYQFA
eukprot:maker-scaffold_16-snap-gene-1.20-mRNA-1 protein AED:0.05 eAED:0.05 QI:124/1/0.66/1/1/1/3/0/1222